MKVVGHIRNKVVTLQPQVREKIMSMLLPCFLTEAVICFSSIAFSELRN